MKFSVDMQLVKETKNTFRYEAPATQPGQLRPSVDCVYVQKTELAGQAAPKSVRVTVEGV